MSEYKRGPQREYGTPHPMRPTAVHLDFEASISPNADTGTIDWSDTTFLIPVKIPADPFPEFANPVKILGTAITDSGAGIASATTGSNEGTFTRTEGSFTDDDWEANTFVYADGYGDDADGVWGIKSATATVLTVHDPEDKIPANAAANGQSLARIQAPPVAIIAIQSVGQLYLQAGIWRVDIQARVANAAGAARDIVMAVTNTAGTTVHREGPVMTVDDGGQRMYKLTAQFHLDTAQGISIRAAQNTAGGGQFTVGGADEPLGIITKIGNASEEDFGD